MRRSFVFVPDSLSKAVRRTQSAIQKIAIGGALPSYMRRWTSSRDGAIAAADVLGRL